jgi:hypothetical protein
MKIKKRKARRIIIKSSEILTDQERATLTIFAEIIADIVIAKMEEKEVPTIQKGKNSVQKFPLNPSKQGRIEKSTMC